MFHLWNKSASVHGDSELYALSLMSGAMRVVPMFAQVGGLVDGTSKAMGIVMLIGFIFGTICVVSGGFAIRRGRHRFRQALHHWRADHRGRSGHREGALHGVWTRRFHASISALSMKAVGAPLSDTNSANDSSGKSLGSRWRFVLGGGRWRLSLGGLAPRPVQCARLRPNDLHCGVCCAHCSCADVRVWIPARGNLPDSDKDLLDTCLNGSGLHA